LKNKLLVFLFIACVLSLVGWQLIHLGGLAARDLPQVEIWLGGPRASIRGYEWPHHNGRLDEWAFITKPVLLKLHLPSGREITTFSMGADISASDAAFAHPVQEEKVLVTGIRTLPLPETVAAGKLVTEVDRIGASLGLIDNPVFVESRNAFASRANGTCEGSGIYRAPHAELERDINFSIWPNSHVGFFGQEYCSLTVDYDWTVESDQQWARLKEKFQF
jgi:hypothetical protein